MPTKVHWRGEGNDHRLGNAPKTGPAAVVVSFSVTPGFSFRAAGRIPQ
jgi:hypothetical protein